MSPRAPPTVGASTVEDAYQRPPCRGCSCKDGIGGSDDSDSLPDRVGATVRVNWVCARACWCAPCPQRWRSGPLRAC